MPFFSSPIEPLIIPSKKNPFPALLLTSRNLNAPGSAKQVHHVEFELGTSGLVYEAGDALGVYAHNCPDLVQDVLLALGCDGEEAVPTPDGATTSLRHALTEYYDLGKPSADLVAACGAAAPVTVRSEAGVTAMVPHHVIDVVLNSGGAKIAPTDFVRGLKRIQPRLYSISSSPKAHCGQVHLTVGAVRYDKEGRPRKGLCSTFLADRAQPGATRIGVFVHSNKAFRPPTNGDTPMIMVGPGTGIAPFRGFLHERRASGAKGRNWLIFGDQRAATDFLYREELDDLQRRGVLARLRVFAGPGGQGLRPTSDAGERRGTVLLAGGRRPFLRVRRCHAHGEGRGPCAAPGGGYRRRQDDGAGGGVYPKPEDSETLCARRVLNPCIRW